MFYFLNSKRLLPCVSALLLLSFCIAGCRTETNGSRLYNIDSLVSEQIEILAARNPKLQKIALVKAGDDTLVYTPDSIGWSRELELFRQLDAMNKPVNRSLYLVDDGLYDPGSNLTVKAITALEPLAVRSMRIFYDPDIRTPRKIEAVYDEKNALYSSTKNLLLEFQQLGNKTVLTSYSIEGGQKMVLSDSVTFSVKGRIQF